jgi:hypothetical protein
MAILVRLHSEDARRREGLSNFQIAIDDAAFYRRPRDLAKMLRAGHVLTEVDRVMLADFIEGKLKRGRGRPSGKPIFRNDWLQAAKWDYDRGARIWKVLSGGRKKIVVRGKRRNFREAFVERCENKHRPAGDHRSLDEFLTRPKNRQ